MPIDIDDKACSRISIAPTRSDLRRISTKKSLNLLPIPDLPSSVVRINRRDLTHALDHQKISGIAFDFQRRCLTAFR